MTGMLLAMLSAVLYGTGVAFEHRKAADTPASTAGRPRLVMMLLREPIWLVGAACEVSGFAAHCAALGNGSLAVVQMVLSASLIVSVALTSRLHGHRLTGRSWLAVAAVVIGVGGSVALLATGGHESTADSPGRLAAAAVLSGLVAAPVTAAAFVARGRSRPVLLGFAAGLLDASIAVITMAFAHVARHGVAAIATSWPTYALIGGGLASVLVTQTAYQADRPLVTLPVIAAVMPLASLLIGATVLGETAHLAGARCDAAVACVVIAVIGLLTLARANALRPRQNSAHAPKPRETTCATGATPWPVNGRSDRLLQHRSGIRKAETAGSPSFSGVGTGAATSPGGPCDTRVPARQRPPALRTSAFWRLPGP